MPVVNDGRGNASGQFTGRRRRFFVQLVLDVSVRLFRSAGRGAIFNAVPDPQMKQLEYH